MDYKSGLNRLLSKRLSKTREARQGDPLIKRRNNRSNRSIMKLTTYMRLLLLGNLNQYSSGYIVYLTPAEYFDPITKERSSTLHESLILGKNCIVYYESNSDWINFSPLHLNWRQVVENSTGLNDWTGEFAVNIPNSVPPKLSFIVRRDQQQNNPAFSWMDDEMKNIYERVSSNRYSLGGKGLGNYDYDFCSNDEQVKICYQLAYLIWNTKGIIDFLSELTNFDLDSWDNANDRNMIKKMGAENYFLKCKNHVENFCRKYSLIDEKKLIQMNIITFDTKNTCCPLCLNEIEANKYLERVTQDEGRESTQNTISEIVLMHIEPLYPGLLNHRIYNLGWGHHDCNTFQGNKSIKVTLNRLREILSKHDNIKLPQ